MCRPPESAIPTEASRRFSEMVLWEPSFSAPLSMPPAKLDAPGFLREDR